ncbi:MAG TPA: ABC transporter substrate-binding protein [Rhizobiaceae bacterium]|nr:ABC transporter substrate-binding protein [Rhizobiaceae bacterium]
MLKRFAKCVVMSGIMSLSVLASPSVAQENVLVEAIGNNPPHLNRLLTTDIGASIVSYPIFDTLVVQDASYAPQPHLALSWQSNVDATEYRFKLRDDVVFHNGDKMTADDVAFTLKTYIPLAPQASFLKDYLQSVEAEDATTVVVKLNKSFAPFVEMLAGIPIVPKSVYGDGQDVATHPANIAPVGSGPFRLASYDMGERVTLERFNEYWGQKPEIDQIVLPIIPDQNSRLLAFEGGDIDFMDGSLVDKSSYSRLLANDQIIALPRGGGVNTLTVHLNARSGPLEKFEVRKALYQAINKAMLTERAYYGFGAPSRGAIPAAISWAASPQVDFNKSLPFDPKAAGAALDAAGFPVGADGKRFSLRLAYISEYGVLQAASGIIKSNLADIGVDVQLIGEEFNVWAKRSYETHDFDMTIVFYTSYQDPSVGVARVYLCNPTDVFFRNSSGICDPELDAAFAEAGATPDRAKRQAAFATAEQRIEGILNSYPLVDDPASDFGRKDRWDFTEAFATMPPDWSLVKKVAN